MRRTSVGTSIQIGLVCLSLLAITLGCGGSTKLDPATDLLKTITTSHDLDKRRAAAQEIAVLPSLTVPEAEKLLPILENRGEDGQLRANIAKAIGNVDPENAKPLLGRLAKVSNGEQAADVVAALYEAMEKLGVRQR